MKNDNIDQNTHNKQKSLYILKNIGTANESLIEVTPLQLLLYKIKKDKEADIADNLNNVDTINKQHTGIQKSERKFAPPSIFDLEIKSEFFELNINYLKNLVDMLFAIYKPQIKEYISLQDKKKYFIIRSQNSVLNCIIETNLFGYHAKLSNKSFS